MRNRPEIWAAGAVIWQGHGPERRIALVHRPRYDDWSLPKGKTEPGECLPATAVREIDEETGVRIRLGLPLDRKNYRTNKGPKRVWYWAGRVQSVHHRDPDAEVDQVSWVSPQEARAKASYPEDVELIEQFLELPMTTPLIIVRHAKAMDRAHWAGRDAARPLTSKGRQQSRDLIPLLKAFGVKRLISSSSNRCVTTLLPFATAERLTIERRGQLSEEEGVEDPRGVERLMAQLRAEVASGGVPTAVCGHRPVLPHMLEALDLPDRPLRKGEAVPVHLDAAGEVIAVERHRPQKDGP